jgi:hypothetical protein
MLAIGLIAIIGSIGLTALSTNVVFAQPPDQPNLAGQVTAGAAKELLDLSTSPPTSFGTHASNPVDTSPSEVGCGEDPGRCGLSQALTAEHGSPQHPSEVIGTICDITSGTAAGCP